MPLLYHGIVKILFAFSRIYTKSKKICRKIIGQIERGEKNATVESIEKISAALNVPLSKLFEKLGAQERTERNVPLECYELLSSKTKEEQEHLYRVLLEVDQYKKNTSKES